MERKRKIYYLPRYGQLGNQLGVLAHLLAFALEYNFEVVFPKDKYLSKNLKQNAESKDWLTFSNILSHRNFSYIINRFTKLVFLNQNRRFFGGLYINREFTVEKEMSSHKFPDRIVVTDWMFRYYDGVIKHQDTIRRWLSFDKSVFQNAEEKLDTIKSTYPDHTLVGVHVRRGDYAHYLDGIYFYEDSIYYTRLTEMAQQIQKPVFIICSNEDLCFKNEKKLTIIYAKGSPVEDIFVMSQCTYILGPPSTFSSWAAFLGNKLLLLLENRNEVALLSKFSNYYL